MPSRPIRNGLAHLGCSSLCSVMQPACSMTRAMWCLRAVSYETQLISRMPQKSSRLFSYAAGTAAEKNRIQHRYKKNIAMTDRLVILYQVWRQSVIAIFCLYLWGARFFSACTPGLIYLGPWSTMTIRLIKTADCCQQHNGRRQINTRELLRRMTNDLYDDLTFDIATKLLSLMTGRTRMLSPSTRHSKTTLRTSRPTTSALRRQGAQRWMCPSRKVSRSEHQQTSRWACPRSLVVRLDWSSERLQSTR